MRGPPEVRVVVDACVLINLAITDRLELLGRLEEWRFITTPEVLDEVKNEEQRARVDAAVAAGALTVEELTGEEVEHFVRLAERLGKGEAACLALAHARGYAVASDEKGQFLQQVEKLKIRAVITTPDVYLVLIRSGLLSVEKADGDKDLLAQNRFTMSFETFAVLLRKEEADE